MPKAMGSLGGPQQRADDQAFARAGALRGVPAAFRAVIHPVDMDGAPRQGVTRATYTQAGTAVAFIAKLSNR
jgi:hypothetical protein